MSDVFWKKVSYLVGLLPIGALFGLMAYVANIEIKDLDLWLHLAVGKFIVEHHFVPLTDVLSCTIQGQPWVNHEWFFQVIVYNVFHIWGAAGIERLQVVMVVLTMLILLFLGYNKEKQLLPTFFLCLTYLVFQQRFTHRPDIFSLFFFAVYIFVLALHIDKKWSIIVLFITQVLWTNIHGFFFFGPLFVMIGLFSEWLKRHVKLPWQWNGSGRLNNEEYQRLKVIAILVVGACCLNPHFVYGALYPIRVFFSFSSGNEIFFKYILELQKPIHFSGILDGGSGDYVFFKVLILLSFMSFVLNRERIDISALLFWFVFLLFSLQAARNVAFFAFAAYLVFITNSMNISAKNIIPLRFTAPKFQYLTSIVLKLLLLIWILQYGEGIAVRSNYDFNKYDFKSEFGGVTLRGYPDKAADFLVANKIKGNFFNDFNSGAYLLGRCFPDIKVFIDGRTEVYGGAFFKQYLKIWEDGNGDAFNEAVSKYQITGVLLNSSRQTIPAGILKYVYKQKEWKLVYFDYDAVVFLKDVPQYQDIIRKNEIDLKTWKPKAVDLFKMGPVNATPYMNYNRAVSLEALGFYDAAMQELEEVGRVSPNYADLYQLKGKIYAQRKDFQKAFENFRIAASFSSGNKKVRLNLALSYFDLEQYEGAIKQYKAIVESWPDDPAGYFQLARSYAKNKQYKESIEMLKKAHQKDSKDSIDILKIGDIMFEQKEYPSAKEAYRLAFEVKDGSADAHRKMASVLKELKDVEGEKKEIETALSLTTSNEVLNKGSKENDIK